MRNYITEFIGTFFLVLVVGLTAGNPGAGAMAPVAIGTVLMVMVYMGGHISGAHYNPAVTLAILMRGKIDAANAGIYMVVQVVAGIVAALTAKMLVGDGFGAPAISDGYSLFQALEVEILFTFALALVILNVATAKSTEGNSFYGLAIGFTILTAAYAGGGISGGAFNPAVGLGGNIIKGAFSDVWVYIVGPLIGGALAALVFKLQHPNE